MHLQDGWGGTIPAYVPIIHVLLHGLEGGLGNQLSCLLWQFSEWHVWSLKVHHRHALYGDYSMGGRVRLFGMRDALVIVSEGPTSLVGRTHMFRLELARTIHQRSNVGICTYYRLPLLAFECE